MKIQFSEQAKEKIVRVAGGDLTGSYLKLHYDTDGCGCAVDGVPILLIVDSCEDDEFIITSNFATVVVDSGKQIFFDECLKVDYIESANSLLLKSPNQVLNPRMAVLDRRTSQK